MFFYGELMNDKNLIYKICKSSDWNLACENGVYNGSSDDVRDGFIHFSAWEQVKGTYDKYFSDQPELVIVTVDINKLPHENLKWEVSRNGEKFPHLYGDLNMDAVVKVEELHDP